MIGFGKLVCHSGRDDETSRPAYGLTAIEGFSVKGLLHHCYYRDRQYHLGFAGQDRAVSPSEGARSHHKQIMHITHSPDRWRVV